MDRQIGQASAKKSGDIPTWHLEERSDRRGREVPPHDDSVNANEEVSLREFQLGFREAQIRKDIA